MYCTPKVRQKKSNFWDQYKQCFFCWNRKESKLSFCR